jgi:hypothetical protein
MSESGNTVKMRLLNRASLAPITGQAAAELRASSKKGLIVAMNTPYIDGQHIMMNMDDDSLRLVEVEGLDGEDHTRFAEVTRFDRETVGDKSSFIIELANVKAADAPQSKVWAPFLRKGGEFIRDGEAF